MNTQEYVQSLFRDYEETETLRDFMEELRTNMDDRIASLEKKGMESAAAFEKARAELGDVSALADEISLKKKQEVFEDAYMGVRRYMKPGRVALYVLAGLVMAFGLIIAAITRYAAVKPGAVFGIFVVFEITGVVAFVLLGLTQETAARFPMSIKRALFYGLSVAAFLMGIATFVFLFRGQREPIAALGTLIPFALPAAALFVFLVLTEKDRSKSWARERRMEDARRGEEMFGSPERAAAFGMKVGALWILAIAAFFIVLFAVGIKFAWIVFVVTIGVQMLIMAAEQNAVNRESRSR